MTRELIVLQHATKSFYLKSFFKRKIVFINTSLLCLRKLIPLTTPILLMRQKRTTSAGGHAWLGCQRGSQLTHGLAKLAPRQLCIFRAMSQPLLHLSLISSPTSSRDRCRFWARSLHLGLDFCGYDSPPSPHALGQSLVHLLVSSCFVE